MLGSPTPLRLSYIANTEVGRLLNGTHNPQDAAIAHLSSGAGRAAESLVYLADMDDERFKGVWPQDGYDNDTVDDGHVHWAAAGALTSLDLCIATASRLGGFAQRPPRGEDSVREYYRVEHSGKIVDKRNLVSPPWRAWIDGVIADSRYEKLLRIRNALVHADALRNTFATTGPVSGHSMRYGYNVGPLTPPVQQSTHTTMRAREIVELSRDVALTHFGTFVDALQSITRSGP